MAQPTDIQIRYCEKCGVTTPHTKVAGILVCVAAHDEDSKQRLAKEIIENERKTGKFNS